MNLRVTVSVLFTLVLCFCNAQVFAADVTAESRIAQVTVYPDSAMITRQAQLKLSAGDYKVTFPDILPEVDENSLKVSAEGEAQVRIEGAQLKREYLKEVPSEKIKQLKDEIQNLEDQIKGLNNLKSALLDEKGFLDSIKLFSGSQIPKDLVTKSPSVKDLDDTLKFLDAKFRDNYSAVMDCELKVRDARERIDVLKRQLSQVSGPVEKVKRSIIVDVEVLKAGSLNLNASYLVGGASWQPLYDARADFEKSQVEFVSYGIVRQFTGEDWQGVEMFLSTAKPSIGGRMPYVSPWFLRPYQPRMADNEFMGAPMKRKMAAQSMAFNKEALDAGALKEEASMLLPAEAPRYSEPEQKGIAVVYKMPRKVDVKADGVESKLPVSAQLLKADFEYSSYPRAVQSAFLGSRVTNAKDLQLLAGRVNIFLDGDFVGTSGIDNTGPGEAFDLYLGADENVKIKREQIEKKVDETIIGNIPSPVKRTNFKYKLTVENYKSKKAKVKLFEAMPVSEDDRIRIKMGQVSLEPKVKDWKDRKGVWLWELELAPKEKKEIIYSYTVENPREMQVEGL
ncbi:MAG: mucoidy inhibitor MuiA family protein [Candidatus Omnitrophica bacterium]|nr:mucoidy inhibitor MuiA family protein [Candidatus Omnitrophota bacterium]